MKTGEIWYIKVLYPNCVMPLQEVVIVDITAYTLAFRDVSNDKAAILRYSKDDLLPVERKRS